MTESTRIINWIASYPKSGNTWVRFMLLNLIHGPQRTTKNLDILIPDIHKCTGQIRVAPDLPVLMKTHFLLSPKMPLFDNTARYIYIVRHPMDTMLSNLNYMYTVHGTAKDPALREKIKHQYVEEFIKWGGDTNWIKFGRGSWIEHVECWLKNEPGLPNLMLRYEDCLADAIDQLRRMCDFIGLRKSPSELEMAASLSTFERMKSIEEEEIAAKSPGFFMSENCEKSIMQGCRFMNRGKAGEAEKELTRTQSEKFLEKFGPTMELAGYDTKVADG